MKKSPWEIKGRKINIAVVGCGRIANNHFKAIQEHEENLKLTAVCDVNSKLALEASKEYGVEGYTDLDQMLASEDIDIVTICTPSGLHPAIAIRVAQSGRHVLTEKPMATRWDDACAMIKTCDNEGVRLFVVKQNRFNATLQLLKKAIDQGRFGKIYMANVNVFWTRPQDYYTQARWRGTWEYDGGAFMNQASHYIDLLHWLIGPVHSIQAMMGTLSRDIQTEDTGVLNVRWRSGAMGSVNVTMLTYPKNLEGSITVLGEKGTVRIGGTAVNDIQEWQFEEMLPEDKTIQDASYQTTSVYGLGHPIYYENVVQCFRGEAQPLVDGREGLTSMEVLVAAYRAARDGITVNLPLEL